MVNPDESKALATWHVSLYIDCPHCDADLDLLVDIPDFWDGRKLEIGESMTEQSNNQEVECPNCRKIIQFYCEY